MSRWMSESQPKTALPARPKPGKRHTLLLYAQFNEQVFWPGIFIVAACAALLIWRPDKLEPGRVYVSIVFAATGLILVLTLLFRLLAFVQCRPEGLLVRTPLQRLLISYDDIRVARPTLMYELFPPDKESWNWRHFLAPVYGKSVVVIELVKLPHRAGWLRMWMGKWLVCSDVVGLALLVRDWMGLRAEFDECLAYQRHLKMLQ